MLQAKRIEVSVLTVLVTVRQSDAQTHWTRICYVRDCKVFNTHFVAQKTHSKVVIYITSCLPGDSIMLAQNSGAMCSGSPSEPVSL